MAISIKKSLYIDPNAIRQVHSQYSKEVLLLCPATKLDMDLHICLLQVETASALA